MAAEAVARPISRSAIVRTIVNVSKRLTNGRDFPVPDWPHCGDRRQSATMGSPNSHQLTSKGKSMAILFVGIDLAKNVFAGNGVDERGKAVLGRSRVVRARLDELIASLPACTFGMEACC